MSLPDPIHNPQSTIQNEDVLDLLIRLVDKSLVQYDEQAGEERYRLLEIIRQYSRDRLVEAGEAQALRDRHVEFYLSLAEMAGRELRGPKQLVWLERLSLEHDNLRAALEWCLTIGESGQWAVDSKVNDSGSDLPTDHHPLTTATDAGLRLAAALSRFWTIRGFRREQRDWLERALSQSGGSPAARAGALIAAGTGEHQGPRLGVSLLEEGLSLYEELGDRAGIAAALLALGWDAYLHDDLTRARARFEECLVIDRERGDRWGIAGALRGLGEIAWREDDHSTARAYYTQGLALAREVGDWYGILYLLNELAQVAWRLGDMGTARACLLESLAAARELNAPGGIAWCLALLANVARHEGDLATARSMFEECAAVQRTRSSLGGVAWALLGAGNVAHAQGEDATARTNYAEALNLFFAEKEQEGGVFALERIAALARAEGKAERAARLLGAAEAVREAIDFPLPPVDREEYYDALVADIRAGLGERYFVEIWASGRAMSLEAAMAYALGQEAEP